MTEKKGPARILVIKLGALGDFIQALGPMKAIADYHRGHHKGAVLTLLTTKPFADMGRACGYFDAVRVDTRPSVLNVPGWISLRRWLRGQSFDRVYDLQTSDRSSVYFRLFFPGPIPEWSGIAGGCSHPHANPDRNAMHTIDRQGDQLKMAGIAQTPLSDLSWAKGDISRFALPSSYALLVPGGARHRPQKRWGGEKFSTLAAQLIQNGVTPVILGAADEAVLCRQLEGACEGAVNLCGATSLQDIALLARGAAFAVGNDTGPMHVIAAAGSPALVLFSRDSDAALCAPRGQVQILAPDSLARLEVEEVLAALRSFVSFPAV